jgi:hypothetical protein
VGDHSIVAGFLSPPATRNLRLPPLIGVGSERRSVLLAGLQACRQVWFWLGSPLNAWTHSTGVEPNDWQSIVQRICSNDALRDRSFSIDKHSRARDVGKYLSVLSKRAKPAAANETRSTPDGLTIHELAKIAAQRLRSQEEDDPGPHRGMVSDSPRSTIASTSPRSPAYRVRRGESWDQSVAARARRRRTHRRSSWCTSL